MSLAQEEPPFEGPCSFLISHKLINEVESKFVSGWLSFMKECGPAAITYPDGSWELFYDLLPPQLRSELESLRQALLAHIWSKRESEGRATGLEGFQTQFRALWEKPRRLYELWYPDSFQRTLGEDSLIVLPGAWNPVASNELEKHRLSIALLLVRRPSDACRKQVSSMIAHWRAMARARPKAGSIPIEKNAVIWHGRAAMLSADFSAVGQQALNCFILSVVNQNGIPPVEAIILGDPECEWLSAPKKSKAIEEFISDQEVLPVPEKGAVTSLGLDVLRQASFRRERGCVEIFFVEPANNQAGGFVERAIEAWLLIGTLGGFGEPFHYHSALDWGAQKERLSFYVDFGRSRVEESLEVLSAILSTTSREVLRVERIELK